MPGYLPFLIETRLKNLNNRIKIPFWSGNARNSSDPSSIDKILLELHRMHMLLFALQVHPL